MRGGSEQAAGGKMPPLRSLEEVYRANVQLIYGYAAARLPYHHDDDHDDHGRPSMPRS